MSEFIYAAILTFTSPFSGVSFPCTLSPMHNPASASGAGFVGKVWMCSSGMGVGEARLVPPSPHSGGSHSSLCQPAPGRVPGDIPQTRTVLGLTHPLPMMILPAQVLRSRVLVMLPPAQFLQSTSPVIILPAQVLWSTVPMMLLPVQVLRAPYSIGEAGVPGWDLLWLC